MTERRGAGVLIVGVGLINLAASLLMLFILGPATIAGGETEARIRYILENETPVRLGWASWIAASLSLTFFFYLMTELIPSRTRAVRGALILAIIGCSADTLSDIVSMGVLPDIAVRFELSQQEIVRIILLEQFDTWDRFSVLCTGGLANLCYGLAGCLVTIAMFRAGSFTPLIRITSVPLWGFTFFMSYGSFALRSDLLPFVVGSTMALFIVWSFLIGFNLIRGES